VWRVALFGWIGALSSILTGTLAPADSQPAVSVVSLEHAVAPKQTLRSIASRYGIDPGVLAAENGRSRTQPLRAGDVLTVRVGHIVPATIADGVVIINIPQRMLFFRGPDGLLVIPIAVGRPDWRTPISPFTIVDKELDPTWDVPVSIAREAAAKGTQLPPRVGPGPDNPLGRHWLRLSVGGVGLHGTNAPSSIYQAVTHGCIRVHPDDIARLFSLLDVGANQSSWPSKATTSSSRFTATSTGCCGRARSRSSGPWRRTAVSPTASTGRRRAGSWPHARGSPAPSPCEPDSARRRLCRAPIRRPP
jgi:lipoprotein-anchoring transpeptidase ErfK/SrfK